MSKQNRRKKLRLVSPYVRLETELAYTRAALGDAASQYTEVLQALIDLLAYFDRAGGGNWTVADVRRIRDIRLIANLWSLPK